MRRSHPVLRAFELLSVVLLLAAAILVCPADVPSPASAADLSALPSFTDVTPAQPWHQAVGELAARDVISGYTDGTFRPRNPVLRAQFAKMADKGFGLWVWETDTSPFTDLGPDITDNLYPHEYVAVAYRVGIIKGTSATTFSPYRNVTRAQAVTMLVRAFQKLHPTVLKSPPAGYVSHWGNFSSTHAAAARVAEYNGLLQGLALTGAARDPWAAMPRGEAALVLWNAMQKTIVVASGRVADTGSAPLPGTQVSLIKGGGSAVRTQATGTDGRYRVTLRLVDICQGGRMENQRLDVWLRTKNSLGYVDVYFPDDPVVFHKYHESTAFVDAGRIGSLTANFALPMGLTVAGKVTNNVLMPLAGAKVEAWARADVAGLSTTTALDGNYVIRGLPESEYRLRASAVLGGVTREVFYSGNPVLVDHNVTGISFIIVP